MDSLLRHFPDISDLQRKQFELLEPLYVEWNQKINVISRKDIGNLYLHHVLHSLAINEVIHFRTGSSILDLGCGGGFPGIPLAILYPEVSFHLVDSVGKKLKVAEAVCEGIGLKNVRFSHCRGEDINGRNYDFVVSRAAMSLPDLYKCVKNNILKQQNNSLPNGIIALKGGDLNSEISSMRHLCTIWNISDFYKEEYFKEKKIIHAAII